MYTYISLKKERNMTLVDNKIVHKKITVVLTLQICVHLQVSRVSETEISVDKFEFTPQNGIKFEKFCHLVFSSIKRLRK